MSTKPYNAINYNNYPIDVKDVSTKVNTQKKAPNFKEKNPFQTHLSKHKFQSQSQRNKENYMKIQTNKAKPSQNNQNDGIKFTNGKEASFKFEKILEPVKKRFLLKIM